MGKALRCYRCGKVSQPCCEDKDKYLEWNIKYLEEKLKSKSGYLPFFSGSLGCSHCGFFNGELTAIGEDHYHLVWSTYENIQDIENNLSKALRKAIDKSNEKDSTKEERLRIYKQIIDNFFRTSSDYFRRLKDVSVDITQS